MTTESADILQQIAERRRRRLAETEPQDQPVLPPGGRTVESRSKTDSFHAALDAKRGRAIIAEIKMGSPRLGSLVERIDPRRQARIYADNGAAALSVVVEPDFFHGSYELLAACKEASGLPALAKDFVVDPRQVEWAAAAGADAVLLIAALLEADELQRYAESARKLGMEPLVETHGAADLDKLAGGDWPLVGVNNRDLRTFEVHFDHSIELVPQLPTAALKVAESGIATAADLRRLAAAGFDAFLIGESLLLSADPARLLGELLA
ncbi:MAG: indole-3-glycerol-phosphate synthase [Thermoanaerobaculia bacterium]